MREKKRTKRQTIIDKILHRKLKIQQHELMCSGRTGNSCSTKYICTVKNMTIQRTAVINISAYDS